MAIEEAAGPAGGVGTKGAGNAQTELAELVSSTGLPESKVVERAIGALHRAWIGNDPNQQGLPFTKEHSTKDADVVLRQLDARMFVLAEGFRYRGSLIVEGQPVDGYTVPAGDRTDLASVPAALTWLVARYGRHSLPALLHDNLVKPDMDPAHREQADTTFREAMKEMRVPFVRRWLMWGAVSVATAFKRGILWKVLAGAWIAFYAAAVIAIALGALSTPTVVAVVASPFVLSLLWGKRYRVGLITAYCLLVLTLPLLVVGATTLAYLAAEGIAQLILKAFGKPAHPVRLNQLER
jgi:Protein of unknown function (DUF1353)